MNSSAAVFNGLAFVILASSGLASIKLWRTNLYRRYRALFCFLIYRFFFYAVVLFWLSDIRSAAYQQFWVISTAISWFISVFLVLELYSLVLERHKGLATLGRWLQYAGLTISLLLSGLSLLPRIRGGEVQQSAILDYYYAIERGLDFSLLIFLLFILFWLTRYPVPLSRNVLIHSAVYSIVFLSNTLGLLARVFFGFQLSRTVSIFLMGVAACCTLAWLIFLTEKGEEVRLSVPRFGPEQEERILNQLEALNRTLLKVSRN